ncbi:MAG: undecaprenyl-diphosphate phosphatase, partial [Lachnospiraceae bacterium]|nr:undecaprenyl-diphosphate phosphatase [Lachnospiraceae bacterium]
MTLLHSILLGIVQGLTEFLPVSSSGHLAIIQNLFHLDIGEGVLFDILLHIGTLGAVLVVYRKEIWQLIVETLGMIADLFFNLRLRAKRRKGETQERFRCIVSNNYRKMAVLMIVSTIPTALIGLMAGKVVADAARTLIVPGICLVVTAVFLFLSDRADEEGKIPRDINYREGVIVGIAQGLSVLPGLSRSGVTIAACLFCGFERSFAVKYSFILSIPAILGAAVLEISQAASEPVMLSM